MYIICNNGTRVRIVRAGGSSLSQEAERLPSLDLPRSLGLMLVDKNSDLRRCVVGRPSNPADFDTRYNSFGRLPGKPIHEECKLEHYDKS